MVTDVDAKAGSGARFVGQRVARREDARFLMGRGCFVDDVAIPGALHVAFARSNVARGRIRSVETTAAAAMPGVKAVFAADDLNHLVREWWVDHEGPEGAHRLFRLLADGDVRFVGQPIAMVVADSRYLAEDAVEAIEVDVDFLPPLVDYEVALEEGAPVVHPELGTNLASTQPTIGSPELDPALVSAPVVLTETFRQHRYACVPMETRGILASWDPAREELTVWISTQGPHGVRSLLSRALGLNDTQVRVIMPDVGGGFGQKMNPSGEEIAVALVAHRLGRPVKWIQDRRENLMSDEHSREEQVTVTLAADEDGRFLAAKAEFLQSAGSFRAAMSDTVPFSVMLFPGPYRIPLYAGSGKSTHTNTSIRGGYRGPWMIETVAREQMVDHMAAYLGIDPLELRKRNVIHDEELPYTLPTGMVYDQITAAATLEHAAKLIGYEQLRKQQQEWREQGRLFGIGISLMVEPSSMSFGTMSTEATIVRVGINGQVDVIASSASHGQGLETTIAQVVADELGIDIGQIRVLQGDTDATPAGGGTGGSRSAVLTSGAAREAAQTVRSQMIAIVAHELEASPDDLEIVDGRIQVVGTSTRGTTFAAVARRAYSEPASLPPGQPAGLEAQARYAPNSPVTWSNACHICTCEVDPDTGAVEILRYVVSEDCGVMINPNVVEGQIAGGVVQGIGGVLYEHLMYDEDGNPLATTFVDYLLPTATEVPVIEYGHIETPAPTNPGGHKGLGEGGAIAAPPAVINAVADALAPLGVRPRTQPLAPAELVALIEAATPGQGS